MEELYNTMDGYVDAEESKDIIEDVLELYIEEQKKKITELTEEVILHRTRITHLEKQLNESPVPIKMKKRLLEAHASNIQKDNEISGLKIEIYELKKFIPEGILINRENKEKPVRGGATATLGDSK